MKLLDPLVLVRVFGKEAKFSCLFNKHVYIRFGASLHALAICFYTKSN